VRARRTKQPGANRTGKLPEDHPLIRAQDAEADETQDWTPPEGEAAEIERFEAQSPSEAALLPSDEGEWVRYQDHAEAMNNAHHERNFWSWKYSRREAECEELAERLTAAEAQRDDLLKAIEEHRAEVEAAALPLNPSAQIRADQKLRKTATRIEEEAGK
jgi:hypothetical protein